MENISKEMLDEKSRQFDELRENTYTTDVMKYLTKNVIAPPYTIVIPNGSWTFVNNNAKVVERTAYQSPYWLKTNYGFHFYIPDSIDEMSQFIKELAAVPRAVSKTIKKENIMAEIEQEFVPKEITINIEAELEKTRTEMKEKAKSLPSVIAIVIKIDKKTKKWAKDNKIGDVVKTDSSVDKINTALDAIFDEHKSSFNSSQWEAIVKIVGVCTGKSGVKLSSLKSSPDLGFDRGICIKMLTNEKDAQHSYPIGEPFIVKDATSYTGICSGGFVPGNTHFDPRRPAIGICDYAEILPLIASIYVDNRAVFKAIENFFS